MKNRRIAPLPLMLVLLFALSAFPVPAAAAQPPLVRKLEPPNWWTHYTPDLTLLLTGEHLSAARVESRRGDVSVLGAEASANGHYLFVRLRLASDVHPGNVDLRINTLAGTTAVQLPLRERADPHGHFESFSLNDVIYLIMPDRFADGDPANDRPPGSSGIYDRSDPHAY
ncbi:MAG: cyclomaltodextrinase N-terminal domain-containing protein, partial [Terriglobales bacterium]